MSRSSRNQWIAVGIIVLLLGAALGAGVLLSDDIMRVEVGGEAPAFTVVDLATNKPVSLADYRGQVVLLNLWATWCAPCRIEMPSMQRLYERLGDDGLNILAVSVDAGDPQIVREFADELGLTFPILHDQTQEIETTYQTTGLPETFLIDRQGVIVYWAIGPEEWDNPAHVARIQRLLDAEG